MLKKIAQKFWMVGTSHVTHGASRQFGIILKEEGGININANRKVIIASHDPSQSQPASQAMCI